MSLRVGIVDAHEIFLRGLVSALSDDPSLEVVLEASSGPIDRPDLDAAVVAWEALDGLELVCPAVVLAPGTGLKSVPPGTRLDVSAVLPRSGLTVERLVIAVRAAAAGMRIDADVPGTPMDALLDERRVEVLQLLGQGADTRTIARTLHYSERTVKTLIHDVQLRLGARTRAEAVAEAYRLGLV